MFTQPLIKAGFVGLVLFGSMNQPVAAQDYDALPSWNSHSASTQAILNFISETTNSESPHFVSPEKRIAVFDNDGTLWPENRCTFSYFS